jgi:hypothetical protein
VAESCEPADCAAAALGLAFEAGGLAFGTVYAATVSVGCDPAPCTANVTQTWAADALTKSAAVALALPSGCSQRGGMLLRSRAAGAAGWTEEQRVGLTFQVGARGR